MGYTEERKHLLDLETLRNQNAGNISRTSREIYGEKERDSSFSRKTRHDRIGEISLEESTRIAKKTSNQVRVEFLDEKSVEKITFGKGRKVTYAGRYQAKYTKIPAREKGVRQTGRKPYEIGRSKYISIAPEGKEQICRYGNKARTTSRYIVSEPVLENKVPMRYSTERHSSREEYQKQEERYTKEADLMMEEKRQGKRYKAIKEKQISVTEEFTEKKNTIVKIIRRVKETMVRNSVFIGSIVLVMFLFVTCSVLLTCCGTALSQGAGTVSVALVPTTDREISDCEAYFRNLEYDLQSQIDRVESDYPDADEYEYNLAEIGHDPYELMAYLGAVYGYYQLSIVQGDLDRIFSQMYILTINEHIEGTGEEEKKVVTVTLVKNNFRDVAEGYMNAEQKQLFNNYVASKGAHQSYSNPLPVDWQGDISSRFGWRIHPITNIKTFHEGIDLAEPEGMEVYATTSGFITSSYYSSSAGNYIILKDHYGNSCHYMHLSERLVEEDTTVHRGDLIGRVGNTGNSTGSHLHIGILSADGEWLDPIFFLSNYVK